MQSNSSIAFQADAHRRRIRQGSVAAAVPHSGHAGTAAQWTVCIRIELLRSFAGFLPSRPQRFEARANSHASAQDLACYCCVAIFQCILNAKFEAIDSEALSEFVVELLLRDRSLRYAETAKRTRGHEVCVHG